MQTDKLSARTTSVRVVTAASIITVSFMGSVLVSPLYPLYEAKFGFSDVTLTLVYAIYAVGNVVALLVFGQVSDQIGRRRAALPGLALAALAGLVFLFAQGTAWLFVGRLLIGLAVGICSGTGTAWLAELFGEGRRENATLTAASANLVGIAIGPLLGGVLAQYAPAPLELPLAAYVVAVGLCAVAVLRSVDVHEAPVTSLREIRLAARIGVPRQTVRAFTAPAVTGFVIFALGGLYFALIPGVLIRDLHQTNIALAGLVIFEFAVVAMAGTWLGRHLPPVTAMRAGLLCLLPAVAAVVLAQSLSSLPLLLLAAAMGGVTLSIGYRGSLLVVNQIAPDDRRAEVVSSYFTACFIGNSVPVIGIGILSTLTSPLTASICFAVLLVVLALGALVWRQPE